MFPVGESASPPAESSPKDWPVTSFKEEPVAPAENTSTGVGSIKSKAGTNFEVQADLMKPQVDSISRLASSEAVSSNQVDVLRKYISLKEAEAKDLKEQLRQTQAML